MAEETTITFAKDDTIIVEEELLSVAAKLAAGGFVRFDRGNEAVMVNAANVRYLRSVRRDCSRSARRDPGGRRVQHLHWKN